MASWAGASHLMDCLSTTAINDQPRLRLDCEVTWIGPTTFAATFRSHSACFHSIVSVHRERPPAAEVIHGKARTKGSVQGNRVRFPSFSGTREAESRSNVGPRHARCVKPDRQ